ncbi:zinc finger BED domain-containing protein 5-like [Tachypleus tridentatus]|uniref:zinc finger BED domain-containing protein 5-like n=1 Tax=Tachypleus tridentatus TaxID=6853 RepID=UPI003FD1F64B
MKPCKLKIHLEKKHTGEKDKPVEYFKKLRDDFQARKTVSQLFNNKVCKMSDGLLASYEISKIIAKAGKPHNVGETVILPAVSVIISSVMKQNGSEITNSIPSSNSSVSRRIDEMAEDVEKQLIAHLQVKQFALQLDESTLRDNEAILLAYVRFNNDEGPKEEMLFAKSLLTDTKGETIFNEVVTYFQKNNIPLKNIIACATDGAPSMTGRYKGFIAHLKKAIPEVFCIHCVIHRQHLVAKKMSARLHDALTVVIQVVNHIKSNSLRDRLFHELCKQNGEEFEQLVLHTEVRWLSKGNCLQHFIALWDSIVSFLANTKLGEQLLANKCDVFFLSDIFEKLNSLNKQLQEKDSDLITSKSAIAAFLRKLQLYKNNIRRRAFKQFPCLASVSSDLQGEDLALYGEYMENMHKDMQTRFSDLLMMVIPTWVSIPFEVKVADIDISLQEPLIELQSDEIMRAKFKDGKYNVWKTNDVATKYPLLWDKAQLYVIAFPTSYLVESGFSRVSQLLSKARNRLDIVKRGDLRLSSMEPDIKKLAEQHQPQGSH